MEKARQFRDLAGFWLGRLIVLVALIGSGYWGFYYLPSQVPWWQAVFGPPALIFIIFLVLGAPEKLKARKKEIVAWAAVAVVIFAIVSALWNWAYDWS